MDVLEKFKNLGWRTSKSSGEEVAGKQDGDGLLEVVLQSFTLPNGIKFAFSISASSEDFSKICSNIAGRKRSHATVCQTYIEKMFADPSEIDVEVLSDEIDVWWKSQSILDAIKAKTQPPPETGQAQLYHLAALAFVGDFTTLMDYQQVFAKGKRMGFVPMIQPEMIDKAVDIALERA